MDEQPPEPHRGPLYGSLRWMQPGCLMWILISFACISTVWIGPLFTPEGESAGTVGVILFLAFGLGVLWLINRTTDYLTGSSNPSSGTAEPGTMDRGAGTMSWHDNDGGGSE